MGVRVPLPGPNTTLSPGVAELVDARNYVDPVDFEKRMKYGIRITYKDGKVKYAYSAKGGYISETDDITETALFAQEQSAINALKTARKDGFESKRNCFLEVIGIEYAVAKVTDVPYPPKKSGYVLAVEKTEMQFGKPVDVPLWFSGPKKAGSNIQWSNAIESATVFPSDFECKAKIAECVEEHKQKIEQKKYELANPTNNHFYRHMSPKDRGEWEDRVKSNIQHEIDKLKWFDTIRIEPA